jgi:hypothetical protein
MFLLQPLAGWILVVGVRLRARPSGQRLGSAGQSARRDQWRCAVGNKRHDAVTIANTRGYMARVRKAVDDTTLSAPPLQLSLWPPLQRIARTFSHQAR